MIPFHLFTFERTKFVVPHCSGWLNLCILYGKPGGFVSFVTKIVQYLSEQEKNRAP